MRERENKTKKYLKYPKKIADKIKESRKKEIIK